jgi:hypothetical protein
MTDAKIENQQKLVILASRDLSTGELNSLSQNSIYKVYQFQNDSNTSIGWDVLWSRYDCVIFNVQYRKSRIFVGKNWADICRTTTVAFVVNWFESVSRPFETWVDEFRFEPDQELHVLYKIKIDEQPKDFSHLIAQVITPVMSKPQAVWKWAAKIFAKCFLRL